MTFLVGTLLIAGIVGIVTGPILGNPAMSISGFAWLWFAFQSYGVQGEEE